MEAYVNANGGGPSCGAILFFQRFQLSIMVQTGTGLVVDQEKLVAVHLTG